MLVEAAALGVPLFAARTGGMADVLQDGRTALLFEPGDEAGCGWALRRAASLDSEHRSAMGAACRALAEAELDGELEVVPLHRGACGVTGGGGRGVAARARRTSLTVVLYYALGGGLGHLTRASPRPGGARVPRRAPPC